MTKKVSPFTKTFSITGVFFKLFDMRGKFDIDLLKKAIEIHTYFFYKQPVYKQPVFGSRFLKQLLVFSIFALVDISKGE